ncbi:MFS transporter [Brevibacillus dissolubilis]|uniref:MFS transporter n=1 Tax=Brevibacillus dissolubilis TaxID=1844116 RepID=UPI0021002F14|nr:MFS transporter [Brevibacillus dissolubilis]
MSTSTIASTSPRTNPTIYRVLFAVSLVHLLNDTLQAVIPALMPTLQKSLLLTYTQVGMISFVMNMVASVFQPVIGYMADRNPRPWLLPIAATLSGLGMVGIALSDQYEWVLLSVALLGLGSAVFHPEASRVVYMAAGDRRGLSQSIFQVGGNAGSALAPLMAIWFFVPFGQPGAMWFTIPAALAVTVLIYIAVWYTGRQKSAKKTSVTIPLNYKKKRYIALLLLVTIISVRSWLYSGIQIFYPLHLINDLGVKTEEAQVYTFLFLLSGAVGTFFGGALSDRFGHRNLLIGSTLGALPFILLIPYVHGFWAYPLLFIGGLVMFSSFSAAVVYGQELMPGRIGMISGLIVGFSFGMGGVGASVLGSIADVQGLFFVMVLCSLMPLIGLLGFTLPKDSQLRKWADEQEQELQAASTKL